ncbi:hypothetical protein K9N68_36400 (plasmid) [Kovacikia minuta CCNUW1]|uniref:hypothetical protein n=1 Tax=Kovacikia minuta TaxID=2931930 RepID=UPI001CCBD896|nr:hypothetical protein [Kovacikia minuta]UBF30649.1 hypothetical protein K9N68_36400 [Kovacikia minuta CCNUW1]
MNNNFSLQVPIVEIRKQGKDSLEKCQSDLTNFLQKKFDETLENDPILAEVVDKLKSLSSKGVVFGGWVRDKVINFQKSKNISSQDIDIVICDLTQSDLKKNLPTSTVANLFGGFSTRTSSNKIDVWLLENTFLIKRFNFPTTFEGLPGTTVFRINSIIFKPKQLWTFPETIELGCIDAINNDVIDFQASIIPFPQIQVSRALIYSVKLKLTLSQEVKTFIKNICDCQSSISLVKKGLQENCPERFLSNTIELFELVLTQGSI